MQSSNVRSTKAVVAANIFLISIKLAVALLTGSIAAIAVLADSLFDLAGSLLAYIGVRKGEAPPDVDHHYGHRKYESLSSLAQLSLIAAVALLIAIEAFKRLIAPFPLSISEAEIGMMLLTVAVDIGIVHYLKKNADARSSAIQASIGNYTSDILQNSLVVAGLFAASTGFYAADPLAALVVAALMLRVVYTISRGALGELTDQSPPQKTLDSYGKALMQVEGVKSFHKMRARSQGGEVKLDVHIHLDKRMPLSRSHSIAEKVKQKIKRDFPEVKDVLVHTEPATAKFMKGPKFGS